MGHLLGRLDRDEDPKGTHLHIWSFSISHKEASVLLHITCHHPVLSLKLLSMAVHFQELVTSDQISSVLSGDRMAERARLGAESPARRL